MEERQELDERKIRELFRQTGDSIQAILDYFRLKNKVLWEGSVTANASSNPTINVPGLSKYQIISVYTTYGSFLSDTGRKVITGLHSDYTDGSNDLFEDYAYGLIAGDTIQWIRTGWARHISNGSHSYNLTNTKVTKIVGIEPLLPDSLKKIAGGG